MGKFLKNRGHILTVTLIVGLVYQPGEVLAKGLFDGLSDLVDSVTEGAADLLPGTSDAVKSVFPGLVTASFVKLLSGGDVDAHEAALMGALATGVIQSWENPETGNSGEVKVLEETTTTEEANVVVLKDKVDQVPPLELKGTNFTATKTSNVRGGPGTDYKVVGSLPVQTVVTVIGKVKGADWYLISQGDVATGFVSASLLTETQTETATSTEPPAGDVESIETVVDQTCKTVEQSVTQDDGTTQIQVITACQGPSGWVIQDA